jgi:UDP-glucose 4-epimerase
VSGDVLVTGGAGFVGSSLVRALLARDYQVTVLDSLVNGSTDYLPEHERLSFVNGDVTDERDLDRVLASGVESVVHLAAHHFIPYCDAHPAETIRTNVFGTQCVLDSIARSGAVRRLVFASTAAVYAPTGDAINETGLVQPIDIYGISKRCGEEMVELFERREGVSCISARLFNVIGPRETNPHLLPDIIEQLTVTDGRLELGNLLPTRDYIYVDDVSDGLVRLLESDVRGSVNVGTGAAYSAREMVGEIEVILGRSLEVVSVPERQRLGDRPVLLADNSLLRELGWQPAGDFRESLRKTLAAYELTSVS